MTTLKLKKLVGINEIGLSQGIKFLPYPVTSFDLSKLLARAKLIRAFNKPVFTLLKSGWIIDGKLIVNDDGTLLGEGFTWDIDSFSSQLRSQIKKLKVDSKAENLSITGFKDLNGAITINREINSEELTNAIFLSGFDNLSHFMMEIAPKSLSFSNILGKYPHIKIVATSDLVHKKWIHFSIKTAESLIKRDFNFTVKQFNPDKAVRFKNIIVISSTTHRGADKVITMAVREVKAFSKQMRKNATSFNNSDQYILYLSRKHASHRRILNQYNLTKIVKKVFPNLKFVLEDQIHKLSMDNQAILIRNANLIIEEGGGSTAFTSNLVGDDTPFVCISTTQRENHASKIYLSGLGKYAAWILGEPIGKLTESPLVDNDIHVNEDEFKSMLVRLSLFLEKKFPMPQI